MGKPQKLILDDCIFNKEAEVDVVEIDSMTNQAYKDNIPSMRRKINEQNKRYAEAYERVKDLIIK